MVIFGPHGWAARRARSRVRVALLSAVLVGSAGIAVTPAAAAPISPAPINTAPISAAPTGIPAADPTPSPSPTGAAPSGVAIVPAPDSRHVAGKGQTLDFGLVDPGGKVSDKVLVRNVGDTTTTVTLYASDANTAVGGGLAFGLSTDKKTGLGAWMKLSQTQVTVGPRASVPLDLVITVPKPVQGGQYAGGVVAEEVNPNPAPTGTGLRQVYRFAMPVYLKVPGGAPGATPGRGRPDGAVTLIDVKFKPVGSDAVCSDATYRNESQDIVNPDATIKTHARWIGGGKTYVYKGIGAVTPDATVTVHLPCVKLPVTGGKVEVELEGPHVDPTHNHRSTELDRTPISVVIAFFLLLLLIALLLVTLVRRLLRSRAV